RVMGIYQFDIKPTLFEHFERSNPVDPRGLQRDGLDLTLLQPCGQGIEIRCKRPTALHRLRISICGHGHPMLGRPDINPGGIYAKGYSTINYFPLSAITDRRNACNQLNTTTRRLPPYGSRSPNGSQP